VLSDEEEMEVPVTILIPPATSAPVSTPLPDSTYVHPKPMSQPIMPNTIPSIHVHIPVSASPPGSLDPMPPQPTLSMAYWSTLLSKI